MAYNSPPGGFYGSQNYPPTPNPQTDDFIGINAQGNFNEEFYVPFYQPSGVVHNPHPARTHSPSLDTAVAFATASTNRSSSEEKELLTPSQRRRKEQNRAAQRAFRERKERHVKELESRLANLEQAHTRSVSENNALKEALEKTQLENRLLQENRPSGRSNSPPLTTTGPLTYTPLDRATAPGGGSSGGSSLYGDSSPPPNFTTPLFSEHPNRGPLHRITTSPGTGEKLLAAGAAWDLILCHPLYEQGLVDIADISERLKGLAKCDGQGPVFEESTVLEAIQASVGSGSDDLL